MAVWELHAGNADIAARMTESARTYRTYQFTRHALEKLGFYGLSKSKIIRAIRHPARAEAGVVRGTVAVMIPADTRRYSEVWAMYQPVQVRGRPAKRIITVWRYPGKSPIRDPVPMAVIEEVRLRAA